VTLAAFKVSFPEFALAGDTYLQDWLDKATLRVSVSQFGTKFDTAHGYMTASLLATSPFGQNARMINKVGRSTYHDAWDDLARTCARGALVV